MKTTLAVSSPVKSGLAPSEESVAQIMKIRQAVAATNLFSIVIQ